MSWSLLGFSQNRLGLLHVRDLDLDSRARKYMNKCTYVRSQWRRHTEVPTVAWIVTEPGVNLPLMQTPYRPPCAEVPQGGSELTPPRRPGAPRFPPWRQFVLSPDHDPHPLAVMNLHCMTRVCVSLTSDFFHPVSSFALLQADKVSDFMQHTRSHSLWVEAAFSPHAPKMLLLDPEPGDLSFLRVKRRPGLGLRLGESL